MRVLKQSTAANVLILMVDSSDHVTGKTGLTLTITASKNGAAFASISPTVTELSAGWYSLALTTAHTNTIGDLAIHATATGADPSDRLCVVESSDLSTVDTVVDAIKAQTDNLPASPAAVGSAMVLTSAYDAAKTAAPTAAAIDAVLTAAHGSGSWGSSSAGSGDTAVNHNTGGTDALRYVTSSGVGIDGATITAYLTTDYVAGSLTAAAIRGQTFTGPDGRWLAPLYLDAGYTYTLTFYKQGAFGVSTSEVTI